MGANCCDRILPGSVDCENQANKGYCSFTGDGGSCSGRVGGAGADVNKGKEFEKVSLKRGHVLATVAQSLAKITKKK